MTKTGIVPDVRDMIKKAFLPELKGAIKGVCIKIDEGLKYVDTKMDEGFKRVDARIDATHEKLATVYDHVLRIAEKDTANLHCFQFQIKDLQKRVDALEG